MVSFEIPLGARCSPIQMESLVLQALLEISKWPCTCFLCISYNTTINEHLSREVGPIQKAASWQFYTLNSCSQAEYNRTSSHYHLHLMQIYQDNDLLQIPLALESEVPKLGPDENLPSCPHTPPASPHYSTVKYNQALKTTPYVIFQLFWGTIKLIFMTIILIEMNYCRPINIVCIL